MGRGDPRDVAVVVDTPHAERVEAAVGHLPADRDRAILGLPGQVEDIGAGAAGPEGTRDVLHLRTEAHVLGRDLFDLVPDADHRDLAPVHHLLVGVGALLRNAAEAVGVAPSGHEAQALVRQALAVDVGDADRLPFMRRGELDADAGVGDRDDFLDREVDGVGAVPFQEDLTILAPPLLAGVKETLHAVPDDAVAVLTDAARPVLHAPVHLDHLEGPNEGRQVADLLHAGGFVPPGVKEVDGLGPAAHDTSVAGRIAGERGLDLAREVLRVAQRRLTELVARGRGVRLTPDGHEHDREDHEQVTLH